jgi:hypothetical protein
MGHPGYIPDVRLGFVLARTPAGLKLFPGRDSETTRLRRALPGDRLEAHRDALRQSLTALVALGWYDAARTDQLGALLAALGAPDDGPSRGIRIDDGPSSPRLGEGPPRVPTTAHRSGTSVGAVVEKAAAFGLPPQLVRRWLDAGGPLERSAPSTFQSLLDEAASIRWDPPAPANETIAASRCPLLRALPVGADDFVISTASLAFDERAQLRSWAVAVGAPRADEADAGTLLKASLLAPTDTSPIGAATRQLHVALGVWQPLAGTFFEHLRGCYADTALRGAHVHYNGHALTHNLSLVPTLKAFGASRVSLSHSFRTGTGILDRLLSFQAGQPPAEPPWPRAAVLASGARAAWRDVPDDERSRLLEQVHAARAAGHILIVDKGGALADDPDPATLEMIRTGAIRFLIHNEADRRALARLPVEPWAIALADGLPKAIEARFIGESYAGFGLEDARSGPVTFFVLGYGLEGRQIAKRLRAAVGRAASTPHRIVVIEIDDARRARARRAGFEVLSGPPETPVDTAVTLVATSGPPSVHGGNVLVFAARNRFHGLPTRGSGFDLRSIEAAARVAHRGNTARNVSALGAGSMPAESRDLHVSAGGAFGDGGPRATVIAAGQSLNLQREQHPDRFAITTNNVVLCTLAAMDLRSPGVRPPPARDDRELVRQTRAHGLLAPRFTPSPLLGAHTIIEPLMRGLLAFQDAEPEAARVVEAALRRADPFLAGQLLFRP